MFYNKNTGLMFYNKNTGLMLQELLHCNIHILGLGVA